MENLEGSGLHAGDWDAEFPYLGLTSDALQGGLESLPSDTMDVLPSLSVPSNEASQPKQLLNFVEETSGASNTLQNDSSAGLHSGVSQAPSPVSVLESNGSCSVEKIVPISSETVIPVCNRSKRSQSSTFKLRLEMSNRLKRKQKKKKKLSWLSGTTEMKGNSSVAWLSGALAMKGKGIQLHVETRKCTHCEVTETPQWRARTNGTKDPLQCVWSSVQVWPSLSRVSSGSESYICSVFTLKLSQEGYRDEKQN
ncbi:hypothetical protein F0562_002074 [Nyssa sinensis]|uniref:GATA-type domain-containing protein n=1 Tax=Nyssa sinensis TaxID=561372 RepID=A0A5J5C8Q6_9ASTE|nr:hypothetical protein F0562_002074 [Nyssa sinensis]